VELWNVTGAGPHLASRESAGSSVVFAPNGKSVALGGATIHLWDTPTGEPLHKRDGHQGEVTSLAFAPDGKVLASGADDRTVHLWDLQTGKVLRRLDLHEKAVSALAFAPDGKTLASGGKDFFLRLWDPATGKQQHSFKLASGVPQALAFSPDGNTLRGRTHEGGARLWQLPEGKELAHFRGCTDPSNPRLQNRLGGEPLRNRGALSADGRLMALPCPERKVRVWDLETGKELVAVEDAKEGTLRTVAISPDGKRLASSVDRRVTLWNLATGKRLDSPGESALITVMAFSPDGKWLVLGTRDGMLCWCDGATGQDLVWYQAHRGAVLSLAFSPDGAMLASGCFDTTVHLWRQP
jgi:WD40 repeat protein